MAAVIASPAYMAKPMQRLMASSVLLAPVLADQDGEAAHEAEDDDLDAGRWGRWRR